MLKKVKYAVISLLTLGLVYSFATAEASVRTEKTGPEGLFHGAAYGQHVPTGERAR